MKFCKYANSMEKNILSQRIFYIDVMKKVGVLISDAKLMFELVEGLRASNIPFEIVDPSERRSNDIGVLITSEKDRPKNVPRKTIMCSLDRVQEVVRESKAALQSNGQIKSLVIGIDPGNCPGIAVIANQSLVEACIVDSPESVAGVVKEYVKLYPSDKTLVRIGHGDRTKRNRIFNAIWDLGLPLEIVDESNTSTVSDQKDIDAAIEIALTSGYRPVKKQKIIPSEGEIADIQRKSRISSEGELTISKSLAESVAKGDISMEDAIEQQRISRKNKNGNQASSKT